MKKVINRGKISKTLHELKTVENINVQKEALPSHKVQAHEKLKHTINMQLQHITKWLPTTKFFLFTCFWKTRVKSVHPDIIMGITTWLFS